MLCSYFEVTNLCFWCDSGCILTDLTQFLGNISRPLPPFILATHLPPSGSMLRRSRDLSTAVCHVFAERRSRSALRDSERFEVRFKSWEGPWNWAMTLGTSDIWRVLCVMKGDLLSRRYNTYERQNKIKQEFSSYTFILIICLNEPGMIKV